MTQSITLRAHLSGSITDFCQNSKLPLITANSLLLVELIVLLARYQEEGITLTPNVYMTNDIKILTAMIPNSEYMKIDKSEKSEAGIHKALKKSAPLAIDNWLIYITEKNNELEYGLFRDSGSSISMSVDDVIMTVKPDELSVVKSFKAANDCVEIRSNSADFHYVFLNHKKPGSVSPHQYVGNLVTSITKNVEKDIKETIVTFLKRLVLDSLGQSHGCIIAVTNMNKVPRFLYKDGISLENPIDFSCLVKRSISKEISDSTLTSNGSLLKGMLNSDGIILFNNKGCLLGYNYFVKFNATNLTGGARRRAFHTIESKIGKGICAVFMQSQDGSTDFKEVE